MRDFSPFPSACVLGDDMTDRDLSFAFIFLLREEEQEAEDHFFF